MSDSLREFFENPDCRPSEGSLRDERVLAFHRSMPGYEATALAEAPGTAAALGLSRLSVKMETQRFGLPSFKVLGASWAACRVLSLRAGWTEPAVSFEQLQEIVAGLPDLSLVAATDGNHGRGVARMALLLGLGAEILVPQGTARARIEAIESEGAIARVIDGTYDDAVEAAAGLASDDRLVISDTSWEGYEEVPAWIAEGYSTIFAELEGQLDFAPELVVVQIGVGALAAATVRALARKGRTIVAIEPAGADCALRAVRDGETAPGPHHSVMAGLNAGVASPLALPLMREGIRVFCAIDDAAVAEAVPALLEDGLTCGETGAAGVAGLFALRGAGDAWERLGLEAPHALAICTEGPTDPASFERYAARAGGDTTG